MSKYKIIGAFNGLLGLAQIVYFLVGVFVTIPKVMQIFSDVGIAEPKLLSAYLGYSLMFLVGLFNLYVAKKLLSKLGNGDIYLKFGVILLVLSLVFSGLIVQVVTLTLIGPLYDFSSGLT